MRVQSSFCNLILAILLILLSITALSINYLVFHYPGNNYFPPYTLYVSSALVLMYLGSLLQFGNDKTLSLILKELIYFFIVMAVLVLATIAAQFSPFKPIDQSILKVESNLGIDIASIIHWTAEHYYINQVLVWVYDSLPFQMTVFPLVIILFRKTERIREYYFLLLTSGIIGFSFYYFFPTLAPASFVDSPLFGEFQKATGLKFNQIHHYITPTTLEGGMVAMPSFHAIWAWFCLFLLRDWGWALAVLIPINTLLILSCVLLGWHYPSDLLGSLIVVWVSHVLLRFNNSHRCVGFHKFK